MVIQSNYPSSRYNVLLRVSTVSRYQNGFVVVERDSQFIVENGEILSIDAIKIITYRYASKENEGTGIILIGLTNTLSICRCKNL